MARTLTQLDYNIPPELIALTHQPVTPEQFERLCGEYRELRLELTSTGELIVMPPTGSKTGRRNSNLTYQLETWARMDGSGISFDSSAGFSLPNGAIRSPDASWVRCEKWDRLTTQQQERFSPFCPDFVIELRCRTDRVSQLHEKMVEYIENGASLGWLIDPFERRVYIYQPDHDLIILDSPQTVSSEPLLPGFTLTLTQLW